jgi:hypothetical protein
MVYYEDLLQDFVLSKLNLDIFAFLSPNKEVKIKFMKL